MPIQNDFRHQLYSAKPPSAEYHVMSANKSLATPLGAAPGDTATPDSIGNRWVDAGVQTIFLVHGTFTGNDALGLIRAVEGWRPAWAQAFRSQAKSLVDQWMEEYGNYTDAYADDLQAKLGVPANTLSVQRFDWSSENTHLGRSEAAIALVDLLRHEAENGRTHIVLWGHSHAGNVFALVTNLLASTPPVNRRFFAATRPRSTDCMAGTPYASQWQRVRQWLNQTPAESRPIQLDIVTFGTPIRYGWDRGGYHRLLHFTYHRPTPQCAEYLTPFPVSVDDLLNATHGDYVQQLGIAGTDFLPMMFSPRNWRCERRLGRLLAADMRRRDTLNYLRCGQRVPADGKTLLVDYHDSGSLSSTIMFGHAVYTQPQWTNFHLSQITASFFGNARDTAR